MEAETEESLRSGVNHENGHKRIVDGSGDRIVPFYSVASTASVELTSQVSKYM